MKPKLRRPREETRNFIIVFNPASGPDRSYNLKNKIQNFFEANGLNCLFYSLQEKNYDTTGLVDLIKQNKNPRLVVAGGDGTVKKTLECLRANKIETPFGIIPVGTANLCARSLGIPLNVDRALEKVISGRPVSVDLGLFNDQHIFLVAACFGQAADVSLTPTRTEKRKLGFRVYLWKIVKLSKKFKKYPFNLLQGKKEKQIKGAHSILICNHLNLHFLKPKRRILPNDGLLHFFMIRNKTRFGLAKAFYEFYGSKKDSNVLRYIPFEEITFTGQDFDQKIHLDGEPIRLEGNQYRFRVLPGAVSIIL